MNDVTGMGFFWSTTSGALSVVIRRVTDSEYSHMGLFFQKTSGNVYFESLFRAGVQGPHDLANVVDFVKKNPANKMLLQPLEWISATDAQAIYAYALQEVGKIGYGRMQLLSQWWLERVGRRYGFRLRNTPDRVTCSEFVARAVAPLMDLRDPVRDHFDAVTPESALRRTEEILAHLSAGQNSLMDSEEISGPTVSLKGCRP